MNLNEAKNYGLHPLVAQILTDKGYFDLTKAQEEAVKEGLCTGKSMVVSAPTSSGKTTIAEIAAVTGALSGKRTLYLVTHKALAEEKFLSFKADYAKEDENLFEVSIATGDHSEGDWHTGILVATYEKYLALLSTSEAYGLEGKVVVADEIQIISDPSRGHDIEILCTIIKSKKPSQFIGLTATAPNAKELAVWFECKPIDVKYREVELREEVWYKGNNYYRYFGKDDYYEDNSGLYPNDTIGAVKYLLNKNIKPILVFTMRKRRSISLANDLALTLAQHSNAYDLADQLELFSEPTSLSKNLKSITERRIAFHNADLSLAERSVIERALRSQSIDVVFSSPTLASGVNFPIMAVVFDSFQRDWISQVIPKSEYLNMSGRAGRKGLHKEGFSILLPHDYAEFHIAKDFLSPTQPNLDSVLLSKSIRKSIIHLIASKLCNTEDELTHFFKQTYWWFQTTESNPKLLEQIPKKITDSIAWFLKYGLILSENEKIYPTALGEAIASTGLLPSTGVWLKDIVINNVETIGNKECELAILHAICASDEFKSKIGQRNSLLYTRNRRPESYAFHTIDTCDKFIDKYYGEDSGRIINSSYGAYLWKCGIAEAELITKFPEKYYGQFYSLAIDVSWILEGLATILRVPELNIDSRIIQKIETLSNCVKLGVPEELITILEIANAANVPGFGRSRAMNLLQNNLTDPNDLFKADLKTIENIVENKERAKLFLDAVSEAFPKRLLAWKNRHIRRVSELDSNYIKLVEDTYDKIGTEYEDAVEVLLKTLGFDITPLDRDRRQGVPDFLIKSNGKSLILECKTKDKKNVVLSTDDAFAILTKGLDIQCDHKVTLGKPEFNPFSIKKVMSAKDITLVTHYNFIEALIHIIEGTQTADSVFKWLIRPGYASIKDLRYTNLPK